jgi:HAMP domain-containing protein
MRVIAAMPIAEIPAAKRKTEIGARVKAVNIIAAVFDSKTLRIAVE